MSVSLYVVLQLTVGRAVVPPPPHLLLSRYVINPRRACAAKVTVVVLSFRPSVCLLSHFLPLRTRRRPISDTNRFSATLAVFFKMVFFVNMLRSKVMA